MKKAVLFFYAAMISIALCLHVSAVAPQKIKSLRGDFASRLSDINLDGEAIDASSLTRIEARPASELEIALVGNDADMDLFLDQNGMPVNTANVTMSRMRAAGVTVRADITSGGDVLENVELAVRNAGAAARPVIRLRFPGEYASLDPVDFSAVLCVSIGGEEQPGARLELAGTLGNHETRVDSSDMTVSADSTVLFANDDIPLISIDAGAGVLVDASMRAGDRCLVSAAPSRDAHDLALIGADSGVVEVIKLIATGFEHGQIKSVSIENGQIMQVYDENGERLGSTSQKLPYAKKYYLENKLSSLKLHTK